MINWGITTVSPGNADDPRPVLTIEPHEFAQHAHIATRLRRGGCKPLNFGAWTGMRWPDTSCTITISDHQGEPHFTELHTGASRMRPTHPIELAPKFVECLRTRVLVALLMPGTLPSVGAGRLLPGELLEFIPEAIEASIWRGELLAGYARVIDHPAPIPQR
jgi:hypothetical protein